ncbi:ABC transporter ATP-binding protein [Corynebacterium casei]|uniref:ABC transporter ATP-binding protein n=1 Tax=Corynebacterium casei TaxID=160386 RepID=UPI003F8FB551
MQLSNNPSVIVRDVSKNYLVSKDGSEVGLSLARRGIQIEALKPLSFVAESGQSIGIIGKNGSGKSTLLNMIAGHEKPTTGQIWVGAQPALLSVTAALQQHLSGMQNIRLGLLASGLTPAQVVEIQHDVAKWAEIGTAIHRPLKTYSSGMGARLRFAIATAVRPEILLVDEALSTGDSAFKAKAEERMAEFLDDASTVFIVSHAAATIRKNCTRALWIHEGELIADGTARAVSGLYGKWSRALSTKDTKLANQLIRRARRQYNAPRIILDKEAALNLGG